MGQMAKPMDERREDFLAALFTCEHGADMCLPCSRFKNERACAQCPECKTAGAVCEEPRPEAPKPEPKLKVIPGDGRCRYCGKRDLHWRKSLRGKNVLWEVYEDNYMNPVERPHFTVCPNSPRKR